MPPPPPTRPRVVYIYLVFFLIKNKQLEWSLRNILKQHLLNLQWMFGDQQHSGARVCPPPGMTTVSHREGRSMWRLSLEFYKALLLQRGAVNWKGRWWGGSPPHRTGPATLCWMRWGVWSVPGARGAASTCPPRWPSSGSACRGLHTRGRVDGCDLQGSSWVWHLSINQSIKKSIWWLKRQQVVMVSAKKQQKKDQNALIFTLHTKGCVFQD